MQKLQKFIKLQKFQKFQKMPSPLLLNRKKQSSFIKINKSLLNKSCSTPKRKILISPSKDLMTFFNQTNAFNIQSVQLNNNKKSVLKLVLNRNSSISTNISKELDDSKQTSISKRSLQRPKSCQSGLKVDNKIKQYKFEQLKREVDIIRKKYIIKSQQKNLKLSHPKTPPTQPTPQQNNAFQSTINHLQLSLKKKSLPKHQSKPTPNLNKIYQPQKKKLSLGCNNKEQVKDMLKDGVRGNNFLQFTFGNMARMDFLGKDRIMIN